MRYTRDELEALSGAPSDKAQALRWSELYAALAAAGFSGEYDGLLATYVPVSRNRNKGSKSSGRGLAADGTKRREAAAAQFLGAWRNGDLGVCCDHCVEADCILSGMHQVIAEPFDQCENVQYEDDGDDDGILKPAFAVEGDPDFESGEPLDGFEYLQRVRWEANQIPGVKVAKIDLSSARSERTPYMPEIPDMPKCSPDVCASKEWGDAFIKYFSEMKLAFSELDRSDGPSVSGGLKNSSKLGSSSEPQTGPTLTMLRNMDAVSRAATLRNYIDMIQNLDTLARNDCLFLFALCIAVDIPMDAETCAALSSLLRKCATVLATKSEMDDEVVMLNILIAVSGRYFGQYENR